MHLGVILQYYDDYVDIRRLVDALAEQVRVTIFGDPRTVKSVRGVHDVREIPVTNRTFRDKLWDVTYSIAGNLPASKGKHYEWKRRRLDARKKPSVVQRALLEASRMVPEVIDFDEYLKRIEGVPACQINDVDVFLSFSDVAHPRFIANVLGAGKPLATYLYSWDHPAKYHRFSKSRIHYLTWNEALKEDLAELHSIPMSNITPVGATQLAPVKRFVASNERRRDVYDFDFVLFAAAAGYDRMIPQEVELARTAALSLARIAPDWRLVVRPYPNARSWTAYETLHDLRNVVIDDHRTHSLKGRAGNEWTNHKLTLIEQSKAVLHIGSTIGLEASYFETPVVHLAFAGISPSHDGPPWSDIDRLIDTYHARRYMLLDGFPNVATSPRELDALLAAIFIDPTPLLQYNQKLASFTPLRDIPEIAERICAALSRLVAESNSHQVGDAFGRP